MQHITRSATLIGTLQGPIWQPGVTAQLPIVVNLKREASRYVNANGSGLVDAVKAAVDGAGDFRFALLTADSFVLLERRRTGPPDGTVRSWARSVDVTRLPSLADYVDVNGWSFGEEA